MKIRNILSVTALSLALLAGCASNQSDTSAESQAKAPSAEMTAFQQSYEAVASAVKKANSVGGEWRDTGKMMKQAKAAAEKGDFAAANKLLDKAKFQAEVGYQQAMAEKTAGPHY